MYEIYVANNKTEKRLREYTHLRKDISEKLQRLKLSPRTEIGAHPLHGKLAGKWSCWLGSNKTNSTNLLIGGGIRKRQEPLSCIIEHATGVEQQRPLVVLDILG